VKRKIRLRSIKDPHTVDFTDGGLTKEGEPTSQRQALARVLAKRVDVDGKPLPVFLVEHVGEWKMSPGEVMPTGDEFVAFEDDVVRREHPPHLLEKWEAARAKFIGSSVERRRQAEAQMEQQMGGEVAKGIKSMVEALAKQTSTATTSKAVARV
jgi:hypothetical protein